MNIRTLDYGTINIVKADKVDKRFDILIDSIEESNSDEWYNIYQLADGKGTIVAVAG